MKRRDLPMRRPLDLLGLALVSCAAGVLASGGCSVVESVGDTLADATQGTVVSDAFRGTARLAESFRDYSPAEEHYIGRAVGAEILARYRVHPDRKLQEYVNLVGLAVLAAPEAKRTFSGYHFVVVEGPEVQAVSVPGGFVFVTEGTVRRAKDEDELAAVLAHEVAHVSLKHGVGSIRAATRKRSLALLAKSAGEIGGTAGGGDLAALAANLGDVAREIASEALVKGYSRGSELDADREAIGYLKASGYSPAALASYLETLAREGTGGEGGWRATHPAPADRIAALRQVEGSGRIAPGREVRKVRFEASVGKS